MGNISRILADLSPDQIKVIQAIQDDTKVYRLAEIAKDVGIPYNDLSPIVRTLRQLSLVQLGSLFNRTHETFAGSGYWLTDLGKSVKERSFKKFF